MKTLLLRLFALSIFASSARADDVSDFFDAALAGHSPYKLVGVTGYDVRGYEIANRTKEIVSVRITYGVKTGDRVITKKFRFAPNGRLVATDRADFQWEIRKNLGWIAGAADQALLELGDEAASKLSFGFLVENKFYDPKNLVAVEGEDYRSAMFSVKNGKVSVTVNDAQGEPVTYSL